MLNFKRWFTEYIAPTAMPGAQPQQPQNVAPNGNMDAMKKQLGQEVADEIMKTNGDPQNALKTVLSRKLKAGQLDPMKLTGLNPQGTAPQVPGTQTPGMQIPTGLR